MRKTAKVLGIIAASLVFVGVSMKMIHFPGGSIFAILGTGLFAGFFLPFFEIYKLKNAITGIERVAAALGWMGGSALAFGLLFTIQYWPGALALTLLGGATSVIFLILYFISLSKYEGDRKRFGIFDVLVVVTFIMLFLGRNFAIDSWSETNRIMVECVNLTAKEATREDEIKESYVKMVTDTNAQFADAAKQLDESTSKILGYINSVKRALIQHQMYLNEGEVSDTFSLRLIRRPTDYDSPTHYMIGSDPANVTGQSKNLKVAIVDHYNTVCQLISQKEFCEKIKGFVPSDENDKSWEASHFYHKTIIEDLTTLVQLKIEILDVEQLALEQLQKNSPK